MAVERAGFVNQGVKDGKRTKICAVYPIDQTKTLCGEKLVKDRVAYQPSQRVTCVRCLGIISGIFGSYTPLGAIKAPLEVRDIKYWK